MIKHDKQLLRARKHIFSTGMDDCASRLAKANMQFGLAKFHAVQKKYGLEPNATYITSPDETISRNAGRWDAGVSYGGKISWGNGKEKLMILDVMPNTCGMLVGGIDKIPDPKKLLETVYDFEQEDCSIFGVPVQWDFNKGNHFIDIFHVKQIDRSIKLPPYLVVLHSGNQELKGDNEKGPGMYYHKSTHLQDVAETVDTDFGESHVLEGDHAKDYMKLQDLAVDFSAKRREIFFKNVFDSNRILINKVHQFMINYNEIMLGCQLITKNNELFPISIRADIPSYIVKGQKNFTMDTIEDLGFKERAAKLGVLNRLRNANILPHGGGYQFPDMLDVGRVFEVKGRRYFEINMANDRGKKILEDVREITFTYRGRGIMLKTMELGLCKMAAKLIPAYVLKI